MTIERPVRRVCVFCGSKSGNRSTHLQLAAELGGALAARGVGLVYGGASIGIMGLVADAAIGAGGEVIGVIPSALAEREVEHLGLSQLHHVPDMHARKSLMYSLADAFIALPGGLGTLEEVFESATWNQLGLHDHPKPLLLLDHDDFWSPLLAFLDDTVDAGFVKPANRAMFQHASSVTDALALLGL